MFSSTATLSKKIGKLIDMRKKHWKRREEEKRGKEVKKKKRNTALTVPRVFFYGGVIFATVVPADWHKESVSRLKIRGARRQVDVERS